MEHSLRIDGYTVFSSNGAEIGTIHDEGPDYVHILTGLLGLGHDLYLPFSCIDRCTPKDRCCVLRLDDWEVGQTKWTIPPEPGNDLTCKEAREAPVEVKIPEAQIPREFTVRVPRDQPPT